MEMLGFEPKSRDAARKNVYVCSLLFNLVELHHSKQRCSQTSDHFSRLDRSHLSRNQPALSEKPPKTTGSVTRKPPAAYAAIAATMFPAATLRRLRRLATASLLLSLAIENCSRFLTCAFRPTTTRSFNLSHPVDTNSSPGSSIIGDLLTISIGPVGVFAQFLLNYAPTTPGRSSIVPRCS